MKIPETGSTSGYYGNDENGQWQNGGLVAGAGGAGDGYVAATVLAVHDAQQGYVMSAPYYVPGATYPAPGDDFADYMWMENEEEFDKQVMQQLEEEALMEQCIEAMLEDEQREQRHRPNGHRPTTSNGRANLSEAVSRSTLNPLAAEFVPGTRLATVPQEEDSDTPQVSATENTAVRIEPTQVVSERTGTKDETDSGKAEVNSDTPEVSAADVQPIQEKRPKEAKKETKAKVESKKKPQVVKSEPKVQAKKETKKETKSKSETKLEEISDSIESAHISETVSKTQSPVLEEVPSGPKPINYAAAARANKPKKANTPPATEKPSQPTTEARKPEKSAPSLEKPVQSSKKPEKSNSSTKITEKVRKNSAK